MVMLPSFVDWILEIMSCFSSGESTKSTTDASLAFRLRLDNSVVLSSVILAVQKCMENFGGFLNPYYGRFLVASCR